MFALEDAPSGSSSNKKEDVRVPPSARSISSNSTNAATSDSNLPPPGWAISTEEKTMSDKIYYAALKSGDKLNGLEAKEIMVKSGLPNEMLGKIWSLCDVDGDKHLGIIYTFRCE